MSGLDAFHDMEQAGWSDPATAADYASHFAQAAALCVPGMVGAAALAPGAAALDVCTGHGIVARGLVDAGATVTGLDFSGAMLDMARAAVPGAAFVQGDAMDLPFENRSFDALTIGFGVPHIPDPARALAEAHRVLRAGGRLVFSVWQGGNGDSVFDIVFGAIAAHGAPGIALPPGPGPHDFADPARAGAALIAAGFGAPQFQTVPSFWSVSAPAAPYDYFAQGTVRGAAVLRPQPEAAGRAIRAAIADGVRAMDGAGPPWRVAIPAVIVSCTA